MPTLKYLEDSFECTTAIKGDDYIHLLDENGIMVAAFDAISDFSSFALENGAYTSPTADHSCKVAVIRDDGTIGVGSHTCEDIGNAVPQTRTVNGKPLSEDIILTPEDVGAAPTGEIYVKSEVLSSSTKALFGFGEDAVPNDVLTLLAQLKLYCWEKEATAKQYVMQEAIASTKVTLVNGASSSNSQATIYYGDTIEMDESGNLSIPDATLGKVCYSGYYSGYSNPELDGKYFKFGSNYYKVDAGAGLGKDRDYDDGDYDYYVWVMARLVYAEEVDEGAQEYVFSTDRNAYPDNGAESNFTYVYKGVPFDNALSITRFEYGSYVGTGTYGESNACNITIGFVPKLLVMLKSSQSMKIKIDGNGVRFAASNYHNNILDFAFPENCATTYAVFALWTNVEYYTAGTDGASSGSGYYPNYGKRSDDGLTYYWYHPRDAATQYNETGLEYTWVAIG